MRTLVIGSGFVGSALASDITRAGGEVVLASRSRPRGGSPLWTALDVTDPDACARVVAGSRCDTIVLVHGPSDVTWCQRHPAQARRGHETAARHVAQAAGGRRIVLISTDNVFDGVRQWPDEHTEPHPANAYGRAKLAAEQVLRRHANVVVLRVSLIYGWDAADSPKWLNFFASCAHRLRAGETVTAPTDQWTTPVMVDDVTAVTTALLAVSSPPPLLHLGGPERISREDWAAVIAESLGTPTELIVPEPRAAGRYADRPANSCLSSTVLGTHPSTRAIRVRGVREGTNLLVAKGVRT